MSTTASGSGNSSRYLDFDEYVDLKLQKTRSTIKSTDILVALAGVATMFLSYLLVFVVCDQWIVTGGFGIGLRWLLLATLVALTAGWLVWSVGIPYFRTVNRLYAAREIEKADSQLKSNLINLVDLRTSGRNVDPAILRALEKNAAVGLQNIDVTQAIDHRPLMRISYTLLAVVVLFCLYALLSPKKISNSIWRSLLPASPLHVATRTEILNVQPGDHTILSRESVPVSVDIAGDVPEKVWLHYSSSDGKFRNEPLELRADSEPTRFKGTLPSVQQDLTYTIRAGDAESREYQITVNQPPSAMVERVNYHFPAYMKLDPAEVAGGQIDSWEGVKVTITARTNMPVKAARVEFLDTSDSGPNGEEVALIVSADGRQLSASWTLGFRSDGSYAKLYHIQCRTESGASDPKPIQYGLTIRPDLPPEVSIVEPVRDQDVPANAVVPLLIEARDPDFELSHINLHVKKNGAAIHKEPLSEGRQQHLHLKSDLQLRRLGDLKAGDELEVWVQAFDNKQPRPNSKVTPDLKLRIVEPVSDKEVEKKLADDKANRDQRLKELEQERNPDRLEQDPPKDAGDVEQRQPPQDPKRDPASAPQKPSDKASNENSADSKEKAGAGTQKQQTANGNQNQGVKNQPGQSEKNENVQSEQPLSAEGDEDQQALQRLIDQLKKGNQQKSKEASGKDSLTEPSETQNRSQDENDANNPPRPDSNPKAGSPKDQDQKSGSTPSKPGSDKKQDQNTNKPMADPATRPEESESKPMPDQPGESPENRPPKSGDKKAATDGKNSKATEQADEARPDKAMPDGKMPGSGGEASAEEKSKPETSNASDQAKPDSGEKGKDSGEKGKEPTSKPESTESGSANPPSGAAQPGENGADSKGPEKGKNGPDKEDAAKNGGESNPAATNSPKNNSPSQEKKGPGADGPQEQTGEQPGAEKKEADGTEKGMAMPDRDPEAKATRSDNPDLKRDPKEKPATRPGDPKENPTNDPASQNADQEAKSPKPQTRETAPQKVDQAKEDAPKTPPGKNQQSRQGDPNSANEPKKGEGSKEQRSKTGSGGEGGTSKEDKEGDPGSQSSGEGDATQRPGSQQSSDKKSEKSDGDRGEGASQSKSSGGKKAGGKGSSGKGGKNDGSSSSETASESGSSEGGKGGESGQSGAQDGKGASDGAGSKGSSGGSGKSSNSGKAGSGQSGKQGPAPGNADPDGKQPIPGPGEYSESEGDGEEANLEFKRQASELVLKKLQDGLERGDVDPEMLEKLGWTEEELRRFADRLGKYLKESRSGEETPESLARRLQFEEMLKGLDVNKKGASRSGQNSPQREVNQIETRRGAVPKEYGKAFEKFSKELNRQKKPASNK